jgi:hypothetical protein
MLSNTVSSNNSGVWMILLPNHTVDYSENRNGYLYIKSKCLQAFQPGDWVSQFVIRQIIR